MTDYPTGWRLPEFQGFSQTHHLGLQRTLMDSGRTRQRRSFNNLPLRFETSIKLRQDELADWFNWWNTNAYDWFNMPVASFYAFEQGNDCDWLNVRCVSDLLVQNDRSFGHVTISFEMETAPLVNDNHPTPVIASNAARTERNRAKRPNRTNATRKAPTAAPVKAKKKPARKKSKAGKVS